MPKYEFAYADFDRRRHDADTVAILENKTKGEAESHRNIFSNWEAFMVYLSNAGWMIVKAEFLEGHEVAWLQREIDQEPPQIVVFNGAVDPEALKKAYQEWKWKSVPPEDPTATDTGNP